MRRIDQNQSGSLFRKHPSVFLDEESTEGVPDKNIWRRLAGAGQHLIEFTGYRSGVPLSRRSLAETETRAVVGNNSRVLSHLLLHPFPSAEVSGLSRFQHHRRPTCSRRQHVHTVALYVDHPAWWF